MGETAMNLIGAMLVMLGCTAAGIIKAHSLSQLDKTYSTLISALMLMKSEISSRAAALDDVLSIVFGAVTGDAARFIEAVIGDFSKLGDETFCTIWSSAAESCLQCVSQRSLSALKALGGSLGRYDSSMQCEAIDRCISELSAEQKSLRETLGANKRMYVGIGGAAGLITAIVLI
ncbi:MAG: stage III sporulation protein AB [Clostridiales bacterium]|nr:stage III sporulation protein AB [Clostridiales bacterium]